MMNENEKNELKKKYHDFDWRCWKNSLTKKQKIQFSKKRENSSQTFDLFDRWIKIKFLIIDAFRFQKRRSLDTNIQIWKLSTRIVINHFLLNQQYHMNWQLFFKIELFFYQCYDFSQNLFSFERFVFRMLNRFHKRFLIMWQNLPKRGHWYIICNKVEFEIFLKI